MRTSNPGDPHVANANGVTDIEWVKLSGLFEVAGRVVDDCSAQCPGTRATINHVRWPDGVADESGMDYEIAVLQFLAEHPLN